MGQGGKSLQKEKRSNKVSYECIYGCKLENKMKKIILLIHVAYLLQACNSSLEKRMIVKHVFTENCIPDSGTICPKYDFYYVYNYKPEDSLILIKMTDTLSIDTINGHHSYFFYTYSSIMPDTIELKNKMKDWDHYQLKESPGMAKHYSNLIMIFSYVESLISQGIHFPASYRITTKGKNNRRNDRYFIKDSSTNKLQEVPQEIVLPIN
jgi:hypothetical protein